MKREAEQKCGGKHCSDAMAGNVNEPVESKEEGSDQGCEAVTLIGSFPERKNFSNDENESDDDENGGNPADLGPKPEPIALRMNRPAVAVGSGTENREDVFKVTKTDSDPRRVANQLKDVRKNTPPEIARDSDIGE